MIRNFTILYADDDHEDVEEMKNLIHQIDDRLSFIAFENGLELINYIAKTNCFAQSPGCIFLDINMPMWDGILTLRTIRLERELRNIPIIVISTSERSEDRAIALENGANTYFTKPTFPAEWEPVKQHLRQVLENLDRSK